MKYDVLRRHIGDKLYEEGDQREAVERDVAHLVKNGVLRAAAGEAATLRDDGPTVAEYVAAGYLATNYPPQGYAVRSTPEEIAQAVAAQEAEAKEKLEREATADRQKAEDTVANKVDEAPEEIAQAVAAQEAEAKDKLEREATADRQKAEDAVANKVDEAHANKAENAAPKNKSAG